MNKKSVLLLLTCTLMLTSCNHSNDSSSFVNEAVSLQTAIDNTQYYNLYFTPNEFVDSTYYSYVEIYSPTDYCYVNNFIGHIILDDDSSFTHQYSISFGDDYYEMTMHGRVGDSSYLDSYVSDQLTFMDLLFIYQSYFTMNENDPFLYQCYGYDLSNTFKDFFQIHGFSYCNYFEIRIDNDGRIKEFNGGETYLDDYSDLILTEQFTLSEGGIKNTYLYDEWVKNNKPTEIRIYDLKSIYFDRFDYKTCYNEETISAIVTNIDFDGSFYIALDDTYTGPIGMKVIKSSSSTYVPKIYDYVSVSGKIGLKTEYNDKDSYSPYFYDAEVNKISEAYSTPMFSEESLVDQNGPGIYAAYLLALNPIFSGSLYTAYAYVSSEPKVDSYDEDIVINLICPDYFSDNNGTIFTMNLILPSLLGEEKIQSILQEIDELGYYQELGTEAKLLMMKDCIYYFDFASNSKGRLGANIYVSEYSTISHRLSFKEMVEQEYSIVDFPVIENETAVTFHFGQSSNYYLESYYGSSERNANGLYYQIYCTTSEMNQYLDEVSSFEGMNFIDAYQYSFSVGYIHYVYQYNDVYVDVVPYSDSGILLVFVYRNDTMIRSKTINEKIDQYCSSFFDSNEFIKLDGTYDYNYRLYALTSYAGHRFDNNNKMIVATMDLNEDRYQELRAAYREIGYKQYREDINDPYSKAYSYVTRGVNHIVYYKQNDNGKFTFLDFASYPTSDYTFTGHNTFQYRVEILIYEGNEPLYTNYTNNMNEFVSYCVSEHGRFNWTLPDDYKAEIYYQQDVDAHYKFYDYGYTFNTDAFIYPSSVSELDNCYNYCISVFEEHGFTYSYAGSKGVCYRYALDPDNMFGSCVYIMKDSRGFIRIINSIGGIDF